mgnify:CR=1 FL=1
MYDGYKALLASIFNQAISDYKELLKMQKKEKLDEERKERIQREIKENERFFRSEWADYLAGYLNITFDAEKLIEKLRKEAE